MPIETSDTKLFDETKQYAEKFPETELNFQTPLPPAHACNINTNPLQDDQKPLASPSLTHGNNKDPINDLHILKNSEQMTMKLFQDFLSFLDERTQHETASHNKERDKNIRPRRIQATDIHLNPTPHASPSNQNTQGKIMHKLTAIHQQIDRMQQTKDDLKQQQLHKKPETRACFRCGKIGHVAKFCRAKPLIQYKTASQAQNSTQRHRKQTLFPPRHRTQAHPKMPIAFEYDPLHNWQLPSLHSRKSFPSQNQLPQHTHSLTLAAPQQPSFSPGTQSG